MFQQCRLLLIFVLIFASALLAEAEGPARFNSINEVVQNWSKDQHLWISGSLPVSDRHLAGLEKWLDDNAENWTVILLRNARGQTFQRYRGMDAVDQALGTQLSNQTGFGNLQDPRTKESNGAFFILFLEERKFSYFASEAFDRRGLGENRWVGRLDRPAIAAMRGGGRIVDAVKDTITNIESQLTRKINAEEAAKKQALIAKKQAIEEARQLSSVVGAEIDRFEQTMSGFRKNAPAATGDLVQPPIAAWRGGVTAIANYAAAEDTKRAVQLADRIRAEIAGFRNGLNRWEKDKPQLERLRKRIDNLNPPPPDVPQLEGILSRADAALKSATENHHLAESLYRDQIEICDRALDQAEAEIEAWQAAVAAEQRRLAARRKMMRIAAIVGAFLFLITLVVLNRLRAPIKRKALLTLREWKTKLRGKFDQLFRLMDRSLVIVGPSSQLKARGFEGATLDLCRETNKTVDELFIMSSATDTVIDRAEKLIEPRSPHGLLSNAFFPGRYRRAIEMLGSKPIGFDREEGLEAILEPARKLNPDAATRSLLGDPEDYRPFRMSFEKLISAYEEKQAEALRSIDRLEHCIDGLPLLLDELNDRYGAVVSSAELLAEAATEDGFFPAENLRKLLLPAALEKLTEATENGRSDPLTAMENPAREANRQLSEALRLVTRIRKVRDHDFPAVRDAAERLENLGRRISWIDDHYAEVSNQTEQIARLATDRSVEAELSEVEDDLLRVLGRVNNCATLSKRADHEMVTLIEETATEANEARKELASKLNLKPDAILSEDELSPFVRIENARRTRGAALTALDHGNVEAAREDFAEIEKSVDEARELIALSREVAESYQQRHEETSKAHFETRESLGSAAGLLDEMIKNYDPRVLLFSERTGQQISGQDSIRESVRRAETRLDSGEKALHESEKSFREGLLIAAAGQLERAGNEIGFAEHQIFLIEDQHTALKEAEKTNSDFLSRLKIRHAELAEPVSERRTMKPTIRQYLAVETELESIGKKLSIGRPNPFSAKLALEEQEGELNSVEQGIEGDRVLFDLAYSAWTDAKGQLSEASRLVNEAHRDNIPDSRKLRQAIHRHDRQADALTDIERALREDHGDWTAIREATFGIVKNIIESKGIMERELRAARAAAEELRRASSALADLQGWRSRHSVTVNRGAGHSHFSAARDALAQGDYSRTLQFANNARDDAHWELNRVRSKERQKQRAAEARRRQSTFQSRSNSGFGSRSSSGGGFSSRSSGVSRSGFSSGSGVSRSGW